MTTMFSKFLKDESGATAIEYSLIAALIGVAVIAAVKKLGTTMSAKFSSIANNLT
ncbi:MAG: Flp family type IVb pilin [Rhodoblastus sp.]|nr:Flp family type IVb pilin [Rhodoblastus sp.]